MGENRPTYERPGRKAYFFSFECGYVGGSGVVFANNKKEAAEKATKLIQTEPLNKQTWPVVEDDLTEINKREGVIISNGDY